ncbi:MAG: tryptophan synthase subunit alpha [candidate division Zixibacteria bacterium]|nr:tryptophan synthase subunit alpha [candidate division Zixibacteria bacterium]MBU1470251.1 tryptophan synthase subunit alpha [candidate division Zixibacteria bacterium]MBU2626431.1 tryptophan synthase subunit alpha [candidate division Zixibacteria bacterium]
MSRSITSSLTELQSNGKKALIPYLTCGYPSSDDFIEYAALLEATGADMLEIGFPHSDPMADGPTIKYTSHQALSNGMNGKKMFSAIEKVASRTSIPLIAMSYINTIMKPGIESFVGRCKDAGITGIIIPDLTLEEKNRVVGAFRKSGIQTIFLVAPTTSSERIKQIASASSGFLYLVSVTGITGARRVLPKETELFISRARALCPIPVCVGFGISNGRIARRMSRASDGVIVGSALLDCIRYATGKRNARRDLSSLMTDLRKGLDL